MRRGEVNALLPFAGLLGLHLLGTALIGAVTRGAWGSALRSPSSAWVALAALYAVSLGVAGLALLALAALAVLLSRPRPSTTLPRVAWFALAALALLILARPWVPTFWDEFVWLGKSRLVSGGFFGNVDAALDPSAKLIPPGYPTLWPSAVGWLGFGQDSLPSQVLAGSLLVWLSAATALEAWWPMLAAATGRWRLVAAAVCLGAPLLLVHLRSTYVDLPVGLLAAALLGQLVTALQRDEVSLAPAAFALALVLPALKDEGLFHVLAACAAAAWVAGTKRGRWRLAAPAVVAVAAAVCWHALTARHQVADSDHLLASPQWGFAPRLLQLWALHATDPLSWGLFWPMTVAVLLQRAPTAEARALRAALVLSAVTFSLAMLAGPERVRAFAENGTLLNRALIQLWPVAALALLLSLSASPTAAPAPAATMPR